MLTRPLRVGIDGHAFSSPAAGVRRYVNGLVSALAALDNAPGIVAIGAASQAALPDGAAGMPATSWVPTNLGWSLDGLPRGIRRAGIDLFHAPAYTAPLWGAHPLVLTIHDVCYERHPEWYPHRIDPLRRMFYRRSARTADIVVTDSEFSRSEIVAAYGLSADRLRVIPLGVGAPFVPVDSDRAEASASPFILHVGDLHPRRNVGVLVEALALLRCDDACRDVDLVLAGVDRGVGSAILARAEALGIATAVRLVPGAGDDAVASLMQRAAVFAYPSVYEGFGLPPLEAMACGAPVIASAAASIPEVVGDAGLLLDPHDVRAWYEALVSVLGSTERAGDMRRAGLERAALFSWRRTAAQTAEVYRSLSVSDMHADRH